MNLPVIAYILAVLRGIDHSFVGTPKCSIEYPSFGRCSTLNLYFAQNSIPTIPCSKRKIIKRLSGDLLFI